MTPLSRLSAAEDESPPQVWSPQVTTAPPSLIAAKARPLPTTVVTPSAVASAAAPGIVPPHSSWPQATTPNFCTNITALRSSLGLPAGPSTSRPSKSSSSRMVRRRYNSLRPQPLAMNVCNEDVTVPATMALCAVSRTRSVRRAIEAPRLVASGGSKSSPLRPRTVTVTISSSFAELGAFDVSPSIVKVTGSGPFQLEAKRIPGPAPPSPN
mmetsp:Transcript_70168/g.157645  ORF Transcript_70168/g.157645 Transcript_70168/m.157645 type:complete len:211 (+) Transcript_70168:1191-1823(+)